jgi:hypothetical protein
VNAVLRYFLQINSVMPSFERQISVSIQIPLFEPLALIRHIPLVVVLIGALYFSTRDLFHLISTTKSFLGGDYCSEWLLENAPKEILARI